MNTIVLTTINARYIHAALGLRYLHAHMEELVDRTRIKEFTAEQRAEDIAEALVSTHANIIGFGVYIWNTGLTEEVVRILKLVAPDTTIVVGGPEVSFELTQQPLCQLSDHTIIGQADFAFRDLCRDLISNGEAQKLITPLPFAPDSLSSPYPFYSDSDIKNRVLYVEASRGCPFKCEFCLSSLDKTAVAFNVDRFIDEIKQLMVRGARQFKFVDRTFNLKISNSEKILNFFLEHVDKQLQLHFELIPDRLPDRLKSLISKFPPGTLQFEIGIQSFNPEVQSLISRTQNHQKTKENLTWLREQSHAHLHVDLIFGLPSETLISCGKGFDLLYQCHPHEIQVGILKRLRGTPINRHTDAYEMKYMTSPPYRIMQTSTINYEDMQRLVRFARYWDMIGNSGRFPATLPVLLIDRPFENFLCFADWLFSVSNQTHKISLQRLFQFLFDYLCTHKSANCPQEAVTQTLLSDFAHNQLKGTPSFSQHSHSEPGAPNVFKRQKRHVKVQKSATVP